MVSSSSGFGKILVDKNVISADQLRDAKKIAKEQGETLGETLVRLEYTTGSNVAKAMARYNNCRYVNLSKVEIAPEIIDMVPESVARENNVLPFDADDASMTLILADPNDYDLLEKLNFILNRKIEVAIAPRDKITQAINVYYGQVLANAQEALVEEFTQTAVDFSLIEDEYDEEDTEGELNEHSSAIVKLVQMIFEEAVQLRASDIHIEPFEEAIRIRYRIDGRLVERDSPPKRLLGAFLSRLKILSKLDIAERRRCQDGRIKVTAGEKELDLRVSVIPTNHGQSIVMRILDKESIKVGLRQLGFGAEEFKRFNNIIRRPNGIVLVTGPTGSGKTTSLYAALNDLNVPGRKIITAEDPVEYYLQGVNQVEIKHSIGLDFARVIRAMLRQAPNVILVGEMRDLETAQMGIQASLTGHLVFSTLHTNDAPSAVTRLTDMGVPSYLVASSVVAIMAQRLVRLICQKCKQTYRPSDAELEAAGITPEMAAGANFMHGAGCAHCHDSGYRGRRAVFELMTMSPKIRELTFEGSTTSELRQAAIAEGMQTLYWDGVNKVLEGLTTIEEVMRIAQRVEED